MKILALNVMTHDCGFVIIEDNKIKYFFEVEKYFKIKHFNYKLWNKDLISRFVNFLIKIDNDFDILCITHDLSIFKKNKLIPDSIINLVYEYILNGKIKYKKIRYFSHHLCHTSCSYYTSKFDDSLVISLDGGGDGKYDFHCGEVFYAQNNDLKLIEKINIPFGRHYEKLSYKVLSQTEFNYDKIYKNELPDLSGRWMAYCSCGKYNIKYKKLCKDILNSNIYSGKNKKLLQLVHSENLLYDKVDSNELDLVDFSFTFQFEWIKSILKFIEKYKSISKNICLSGGCFLNVVLNYKLINSGLFDNYHFIPTTDDSGLFLGAGLNQIKTKVNINKITGSKPYDKIDKKYHSKKLTEDKLVDLLINQKIIGLMRNGIEIGPRALGNRSIICDPRKKEMQDILNNKVKHREWFRPFGIIILEEDLENFYDIKGNYPFMNIIGFNKTDKLKAVTHLDNSTRIQTINKDNNIFLYNVIKKFKKLTGVPAILNTSFNINGQPIINWYEEAFKLLKQNKINNLVTNDKIYFKDNT